MVRRIFLREKSRRNLGNQFAKSLTTIKIEFVNVRYNNYFGSSTPIDLVDSQTDYANTFNQMPFIIQSLSLIIFMIRLLLAVFTRTYTDSPNRRRYSTSINISGSLPITSIIPSYFLRKFLYNFRIYKCYFMHQC